MVLIINDLYLKAACPCWLTGKLSDFTGLFVFVLFWARFFPRYRVSIYMLTALTFVWWKSPFSAGFIDSFSSVFYGIDRVVDATDLWALLVLPIAYFWIEKREFRSLNMSPILMGGIAFMAFCATSIIEPNVQFNHTQYILFEKGVESILPKDKRYFKANRIDTLDNYILLSVDNLPLKKRPAYYDDYVKVEVLQQFPAIALTVHPFPVDSLLSFLVTAPTNLLKHSLPDSQQVDLHFLQGLLHGVHKIYHKNGKLAIIGHFEEGIEQGVWMYYNDLGQMEKKCYFQHGEIVKTELIEGNHVFQTNELETRQEFIARCRWGAAILILGALILVYLIRRSYLFYQEKGAPKLNTSVWQTFLLGLVMGILSFGIYLFCPIETVVGYHFIVYVLMLGIFYPIGIIIIMIGIITMVKLRSFWTVLWIILLFSVMMLLIDLVNFLNKISV